MIESMDSLQQKNINCYSCVGLCCTFESNAMQVTPQEALDVLMLLHSQNRINNELIKELQTTVTQYRLDKELSTGRNSTLRRFYTCTFYKPGDKGCTLTKEDKPYGCLGYNAKEEKAVIQNQCGSDLSLLALQDQSNQDDEWALKLKEELNLYWIKLPLPVALLDLLSKV
ncbi:MAG: hypothetical protein ACOYL6_14945 [Bacteriovoracaceae bacterium]